MSRRLLSVWIIAVAGVLTLRASGPVVVYAVIERVVFEPDQSSAQRVQIWGAFSLHSTDAPYSNTFSDAQRGYLYYRMNLPPSCRDRNTSDPACADIEKSTRAIWSDLQKMVGNGSAVSFGGNIGAPNPGKIRKAAQQPESPDPFPLGNPVVILGPSQTDISTKLQKALQSK